MVGSYVRNGGIQIGYVPLSHPAFKEVSALNGGKPRECNIKLTPVGNGFSFEPDNGPARWTSSEIMRREVEAAESSQATEALLESKLYERLTDAEWERVLAGKSAKELVPERWE